MVLMETIKFYLKIYTGNMESVSDNIKNILHAKEFEYWHCYDSQTNLVFNYIKQKMNSLFSKNNQAKELGLEFLDEEISDDDSETNKNT